MRRVLTALQVSRRPTQRSKILQSLTILYVIYRSTLYAPESLEVLSGTPENLLKSLRACCLTPGGPGSIRKYLEALVRLTRVSGRFECGFQNNLHCADEWMESWGSCDLMFESILTFIAVCQPVQVVVMCQQDSSTIPKLHEPYESWQLLKGVKLDVMVS